MLLYNCEIYKCYIKLNNVHALQNMLNDLNLLQEKHKSVPDTHMTCDHHIVADTLSVYTASKRIPEVCHKRALTSINPSILFLIARGSGMNLLVNC